MAAAAISFHMQDLTTPTCHAYTSPAPTTTWCGSTQHRGHRLRPPNPRGGAGATWGGANPIADTISSLAQRLTVPGKASDKFRESSELKLARQAARRAPAHEARAVWKLVAKKRKQEQRVWHHALVFQASHANWGAKRALDSHSARVGWQHHLMDSDSWKTDLTNNFKGIFAKAPAGRTSRALGDTRRALTTLCKHTPWRPFTEHDLMWATRTWKQLMQEPQWTARLLHMMNDFLYKGGDTAASPAGSDHLAPQDCGGSHHLGDTRPITLSSAILKWFAQLLLPGQRPLWQSGG